MRSSAIVKLTLLGAVALTAGCSSSDQQAQQMYQGDSYSSGTMFSHTRTYGRGFGRSSTATRTGTVRGGFGGLGRFFGALS